MKNRLIIAAYRLPFSIQKKNNEYHLKQNSGGLVSAILSLAQNLSSSDRYDYEEKITWYGVIEKKKEKIPKLYFESENFIAQPVYLEKNINEKFYEGFCNGTIWPLFHYFTSITSYENSSFEAYEKANQIYFEEIRKELQDGDFIWIHDYHLFLLPKLIRNEFPNARIGFFLHIPFPSYEMYRLLPKQWGEQILTGLMGADLIGFHTNDYAQHFLKTTRRILGFDNNLRTIKTDDRIVKVDAFPISIDFHEFHNAYDDQAVAAERAKIHKLFKNRKLIFSTDRLDYSKGLMNRLAGYELFLENNKEWHGKISFIMVVVPSRDNILWYKEMKKELEETIGRINGKYARIDWIPVNYQYRSLNFQELVALYSISDVALITPVRDGMNLVAKEFIASRKDKRGVLILSEMTGAASELGEAILINPTDKEAIACGISRAIQMPEEDQMIRIEKMQERIKSYDVYRWANDFFSQVEYIKRYQKDMNVNIITFEILNQIKEAYHASQKRLLLFDYDGTLVPFSKFPGDAVPGEQVLNLLKNLSENTQNDVVIISGRDRKSLDQWLGHLPIKIIAEHGAISKTPGQGWIRKDNIDTSWKETLKPILDNYVVRCNASFIEEKETSLAWHYRNADSDFAFIRSRELLEELSDLATQLPDIQLLDGNKVIEIKSLSHNKGTAAARLIAEYDYDFILAAGDDKTDEDLFSVMPQGAHSIKVGAEPSNARYNVKNQKNMIYSLEYIFE
jgi:trehalose 6-phosphate synthase/phosphatase